MIERNAFIDAGLGGSHDGGNKPTDRQQTRLSPSLKVSLWEYAVRLYQDLDLDLEGGGQGVEGVADGFRVNVLKDHVEALWRCGESLQRLLDAEPYNVTYLSLLGQDSQPEPISHLPLNP